MDELREKAKQGISVEALQTEYKLTGVAIKRILKSNFNPPDIVRDRQETRKIASKSIHFAKVNLKSK